MSADAENGLPTEAAPATVAEPLRGGALAFGGGLAASHRGAPAAEVPGGEGLVPETWAQPGMEREAPEVPVEAAPQSAVVDGKTDLTTGEAVTSHPDFPAVDTEPTTRATNFQDHQRTTIARAAVAGLSAADIAQLVNCSPPTITRALKEDLVIQDRMRIAEGQIQCAIVNHRFEMMSKLEKCHLAIDRALDSADEKVASTTAFKVIEMVVPKAPTQVDLNVVDENTHYDPVERAAIVDTFKEVREVVSVIRKLRSEGGVDYRQSIVNGDLPGPGDVDGHES